MERSKGIAIVLLVSWLGSITSEGIAQDLYGVRTGAIETEACGGGVCHKDLVPAHAELFARSFRDQADAVTFPTLRTNASSEAGVLAELGRVGGSARAEVEVRPSNQQESASASFRGFAQFSDELTLMRQPGTATPEERRINEPAPMLYVFSMAPSNQSTGGVHVENQGTLLGLEYSNSAGLPQNAALRTSGIIDDELQKRIIVGFPGDVLQITGALEYSNSINVATRGSETSSTAFNGSTQYRLEKLSPTATYVTLSGANYGQDALASKAGLIQVIKGVWTAVTTYYSVKTTIEDLPFSAYGTISQASGAHSLYSLIQTLLDPPSPDFQEKVTPSFVSAPTLDFRTPTLTASVNSSLEKALLQASYLSAASRTLDRLSGAVQAGDKAATLLQHQSFLELAGKASIASSALAEANVNLLQALEEAGVVRNITESDIARFRGLLAANGFPIEEEQVLRALGLMSSQIEELRQLFLTVDPSSVPKDLASALIGSIQLNYLTASLLADPDIFIQGFQGPMVPEPSALQLLLIGLVLLLYFRMPLIYSRRRPAKSQLSQ